MMHDVVPRDERGGKFAGVHSGREARPEYAADRAEASHKRRYQDEERGKRHQIVEVEGVSQPGQCPKDAERYEESEVLSDDRPDSHRPAPGVEDGGTGRGERGNPERQARPGWEVDDEDRGEHEDRERDDIPGCGDGRGGDHVEVEAVAVTRKRDDHGDPHHHEPRDDPARDRDQHKIGDAHRREAGQKACQVGEYAENEGYEDGYDKRSANVVAENGPLLKVDREDPEVHRRREAGCENPGDVAPHIDDRRQEHHQAGYQHEDFTCGAKIDARNARYGGADEQGA
ncbi:hypothetical protein DSECCO2_492620 [anaerobic digester metagenome]